MVATYSVLMEPLVCLGLLGAHFYKCYLDYWGATPGPEVLPNWASFKGSETSSRTSRCAITESASPSLSLPNMSGFHFSLYLHIQPFTSTRQKFNMSLTSPAGNGRERSKTGCHVHNDDILMPKPRMTSPAVSWRLKTA